jgi:uncharacterized protein YecE (DUF72 family)
LRFLSLTKPDVAASNFVRRKRVQPQDAHSRDPMARKSVLVGTAGWSIPRALAGEFATEGSHLQRYSRKLPCAEINSSFHREHSFETYRKWAALTPAGFKFSVKLSRVITHDQELRRARALLKNFLAQAAGLGRKFGPLLIQLPPSLEFNSRVAAAFFAMLRDEHSGIVVCEPRHESWFESKAEMTLTRYHIARVATDPTRIEAARTPGGWMGQHRDALAYYRFHGSPRKYYSRYEAARIEQWAEEFASISRTTPVWCIFDNTASGAALANALEIDAMLKVGKERR